MEQVIYKASRFGNTDFGVAHYAGEVVYSVETFLMKNTDKLSKDRMGPSLERYDDDDDDDDEDKVMMVAALLRLVQMKMFVLRVCFL